VGIRVDVELQARDAGEAVRRGDLIIVIDALRSGTSIVHALSNGAEAVIPVPSLREAYRLRAQHPEYLLAGERGGRRLAGFDLGNSPLEFSSVVVGGRTLVMTTTSGTAALVRSGEAKWVLVGAFLNADAVAEKAEEIASREGIDISFVLAGEKVKFSLEDALCAGAIADELTASKARFSDKTRVALLAYKQAGSDLAENIMEAEHARHLVRLGFREDVVFSCKLNTSISVPFYKDGRIRLPK
jgi:2-phosphosulfolactate phosphatase